jgi:hypothetical protein
LPHQIVAHIFFLGGLWRARASALDQQRLGCDDEEIGDLIDLQLLEDVNVFEVRAGHSGHETRVQIQLSPMIYADRRASKSGSSLT